MRVLVTICCLVGVGLFVGGCKGADKSVECSQHSDCNLRFGGSCDVYTMTGNKWCTYPDTECDSQRRWSSFDTGDGVSGECVTSDPIDASMPIDGPVVDAAIADAAITDAGVPDAMPTCVERISFVDFRVAAIGGCDCYGVLATVRPNGTGYTEVYTSNAEIVSTSWSAYGDRIAFVEHLTTGARHVRIVLTDGSGSSTTPFTGNASSSPQQVRWSPDGARIAYTVDNGASGYQLFVMAENGSGSTSIVSTSGSFGNLAWSPNSDKLLYGHTALGSSSNIEVVNANGTGQTTIVSNAAEDWDPHWTHDGQRVVFMTDRDGNDEVYIVDADGTNSQNITQTSENEFHLAVSPAEARVVFATGTGANPQLRRKLIDASGSQPLANGVSPAWSSDGQYVTYTMSNTPPSAARGWIWKADKTGNGQVELTTDTTWIARRSQWSPCQ